MCKTDVRNPVKVICLYAACELVSREDVVVDCGDAGKLHTRQGAQKTKEAQKLQCVFYP